MVFCYSISVEIRKQGNADKSGSADLHTKKEAERAMVEKIVEINRGDYI